MTSISTNGQHGPTDTPVGGPKKPNLADDIERLETMTDDSELVQLAAQGSDAIGFVHFDSTSGKSAIVEVLVHYGDLRVRLGTIRLFFVAFFDADSASFGRRLARDCSACAGLS